MTNLEELKEAESNLRIILDSVPATAIDSVSMINIILSTYLPSIAKTLAIIADNMSEKDKEEVNDN